MEEREEPSNSKMNTKKQTLSNKLQSIYSTIRKKTEPVVFFLKKRVLRYIVSLLLLILVVYFYIVYESNRTTSSAKILFFFSLPTNMLVPLGLLFALIAVLYVSWGDSFFKKYRAPALYVVVLTAIFYTLIYSNLSQYLFQTGLAKWLTRLTAIIVIGVLKLFGFNIIDSVWDPDNVLTTIVIQGSSGTKSIGINAACSGIHSLTVFSAIFLLMIFESRKKLKWDYRVLLVTVVGILGTYLLNLIRVGIILGLYFPMDWSQLETIHNYLGYAFLIMWIPIYWLFILPMAENETEKKKRKESRLKKKKETRQETQQETQEETQQEKDDKEPYIKKKDS
ncbi:MAG: exosortase/archaeosortase family protein [Candidatus Heimdallarchaeaceae archaeon]